MTEAQQPIASVTKEIVPLGMLGMFSVGGVTGRPAHDVT